MNLIETEPVDRLDRAIRRAITQALALDPVSEQSEIVVDVANGVVQLTGEVESWPERRRPADLAKGVIGVTEVHHDLQVRADQEKRRRPGDRRQTKAPVGHADRCRPNHRPGR